MNGCAVKYTEVNLWQEGAFAIALTYIKVCSVKGTASASLRWGFWT